MWNRFWFLVSAIWFLFCLVGYNSTSAAHPEHQSGWLWLGMAGFALWVMGYRVKNGFRKGDGG